MNPLPLSSYLRQGLQFILPFFVFEIIKQKDEMYDAMRYCWMAALIYSVLTDVHALLTGAKYGGIIGNYLVGNKFSLCYLHYYMLGFFLFVWDERKFKDRLILIFMYFLSIFAAVYSECSTVLLGLILFVVMYFFRSKVFPVLQKPSFALILILISNVVLIVFPAVLSIGPIRYVIENVLHEDISLTGRMRGYARMLGALLYNPVWGVGYYNKYLISRFFTNMDDLQNGLADVALAFGIVGVVFLLYMIVATFLIGGGKKSLGFMFVAYMFILISSVEITLNLRFIVLLPLIMVCEKDDPKESLIVWN
jgi:O-antigen ligase